MRCSEDEVDENQIDEDDDILFYGLTYPKTVPQERGLHVTKDLDQRGKRKTVFREAMKVVVKLLQKYTSEVFVVRTRGVVE